MFKPELLAPAGSVSVLKAAANTGADAVYFGLSSFNARSGAVNLNHEQALEGIEYLHVRGKKAYITFNTLLKNNELDEALREIEFINSSGCDGVIVQDWGAAALISKAAPKLTVHGSTQMSVCNLEGVEHLYKKGIKRVVLARELSLDEIAYIKRNTSCEIEIFIHGALCVSYSGQCYMSSFIGGRSGNRGKCAQPCRMKYSCEGKKGTLLSLKDMESTEFIDRIKEIKADSLKIEGRLKNEYYTAVVVDSYRRLLDGEKLSGKDKELLLSIFDRGGYTSYFDNSIKNMFCYNKNENPYNEYEKKAENKFIEIIKEEKLPDKFKKKISAKLSLKKGEKPYLEFNCGETISSVEGDNRVSEAINAPLTEEKIIRSFDKFGNNPYKIDKMEIDMDNDIFMPVSEINELRRKMVEKLSAKQKRPFCNIGINIRKRKPCEPEYIIKVINDRQYKWAKTKTAAYIMAPAEIVFNDDNPQTGRTVITLPPVLSDDFSDELKPKLAELRKKGFIYGCASNISHFELLKDYKIFTDFRMNITNSESFGFLDDIYIAGISGELNLKEISFINPRKKIMACGYGYPELMIMKNCIKKSVTGKCLKRNAELKDRMGERFTILCADECRNIILNSHPVIMSDKISDMCNAGIDYILLSYTKEEINECERVYNMFEKKEKPDKNFTRGHFFRGVQ